MHLHFVKYASEKRLSLCLGLVAHQAGVNPGTRRMSTPPWAMLDGILVHRKVIPSIKLASTNL